MITKKKINLSEKIFIAGGSGMVGSATYKVLMKNGYGSKAGNRHKGRKTRSCAKKRFNTLPDGTVIRKMTGHRHKTGWKSSQQMKRLRVTRNLSGNWAKKVKFLLGDYK